MVFYESEIILIIAFYIWLTYYHLLHRLNGWVFGKRISIDNPYNFHRYIN